MRSAELHIAEGKCEKWTKPLDRNSVRERTEHLETYRQRDARYRQKKRKKELSQARRRATRDIESAGSQPRLALLAPWHQAEAHGRQSERSQASPAQGPPDKAHAMRQTALFQRAGGRPRPANDGATGAQATARGWPASAPGPGRSAGALSVLPGIQIVPARTCRKDGRISAFIQHLDQGKRDA